MQETTFLAETFVLCLFFVLFLAGGRASAVWARAVRNIGRVGGEGTMHGPWMIAGSFLPRKAPTLAPVAGAGKPLQPFPEQ